MYEMEMLFGVKGGLKSFDEMVAGTNIPSFQTEFQTLKISQKTPFVPDDNVINQYCNVIKEKLNANKTFSVNKVYFKGYTKFKEI